jgi:polymorphic membrane protein
MDYFRPSLLVDDGGTVAAWESQATLTADTPELAEALRTRGGELFSRFAGHYVHLRALPRGTRRRLLGRLADCQASIPISADLRQRLVRTLAGGALLLALAQGAEAATIKVTTNIPDINDGDGKCSLIEAIVNANDHASTHEDCAGGDLGANTIVLPKKMTHVLTQPFTSYDNATGLPVIISDVTIQGKKSSIDGSSFLRIFVVDREGNLTLNNVNLTGGNAAIGGAILNEGSLILLNSIISGNQASIHGGALYNEGAVTINKSTIANNSVNYLGGGIFNQRGSITIINSSISGNTTRNFGGGLFNHSAYRLRIFNSTIAGNSANFGGGIFTYDSYVGIYNSTLSGNTGYSGGGGLWNYGYNTKVVIANSTISGNSAGQYGGGILNVSSPSALFTIQNSTISGNIANNKGGGIYNLAYGDFTYERYGYLIFKGSLVAGNFAPVGTEIYTNNTAGGAVYDDAFNLFGYDGDPGLAGFSAGATDIVPKAGVMLDSILKPLNNNGGLTETYALVKGSPAIDAIPAFDPRCSGTDQRGVVRPRGAGCDIGAFER